ncbi:MAG: hypothetical protein SFV51_21835 [Bryobacteraceae bacterium]|nr:hypothetical protein [Bryobacteraceae bacterium]
MATEKQQHASRTNGAKSNGPVTAEGKARVAQNPIRHGLASRAVVLANESVDEYNALLQAYRREWEPEGQTQDDLVTELANAQWRLRRIAAIETATLDTEILLRGEEFDEALPEGSTEMRQADAFLSVALHNVASLDQLHRYESRYTNIYHRALKTLAWLKRHLVSQRPTPETPCDSCVVPPPDTAPAQPLTPVEPANCTSKPGAATLVHKLTRFLTRKPGN